MLQTRDETPEESAFQKGRSASYLHGLGPPATQPRLKHYTNVPGLQTLLCPRPEPAVCSLGRIALTAVQSIALPGSRSRLWRSRLWRAPRPRRSPISRVPKNAPLPRVG